MTDFSFKPQKTWSDEVLDKMQEQNKSNAEVPKKTQEQLEADRKFEAAKEGIKKYFERDGQEGVTTTQEYNLLSEYLKKYGKDLSERVKQWAIDTLNAGGQMYAQMKAKEQDFSSLEPDDMLKVLKSKYDKPMSKDTIESIKADLAILDNLDSGKYYKPIMYLHALCDKYNAKYSPIDDNPGRMTAEMNKD